MALDWLNIAGGAAQGAIQGDEDNRRRQEFQAMQRQRDRVEKQQKMDDELAAQLKTVRPEGDVEAPKAVGQETEPGFVGPGSGKQVIGKRTAADVARDQAGLYGKSGDLRHMQEAARLRQGAYAYDAADRTEREAKGREALTQAGQLLATGNRYGAARVLQDAYKKHVPDGHELKIEQGSDGSMWWGVTGPDGSWVEPPEHVTDESLQKRIDQGFGMLSPELRFQQKKLGIEERTAKAHETTAGAAELSARSKADEATYNTTGPGGQAHLQYLADQGVYLDRHGRAMLMEAQSRVAASKKLSPAEKAKELTDFYMPIIQQANPGMPAEQVRMKAAQVALRDPNAKAPTDNLGNSDLVKIEGKYYRQGPKGNLVEARLPADMSALAGRMASVLGAGDDDRPSATTPNSSFKGVSTPKVTSTAGAAPIAATDVDEWVPQLSTGRFGIGRNRNYVNRRTGETISGNDFEQRTR